MTKCCIVPGDESRAMVKMTTTIEGQPVSFYSCHLDYRNYECYMPRGYSGTSWKKIDNPITDESEVLKANRLSFRDESIRTFVQEVQTDIKQGCPVLWEEISTSLPIWTGRRTQKIYGITMGLSFIGIVL